MRKRKMSFQVEDMKNEASVDHDHTSPLAFLQIQSSALFC